MRSSQETQESKDPRQLARNAPGLLLENERVRVLHAFIKAGENAAMHSHPDHVLYALKDSRVELKYPDGKVDTVELEAGKAIFMTAQSHEVRNIGQTDMDLVVVELK